MTDQPSPKYRSWHIETRYAWGVGLMCWAGFAVVCAVVLGGRARAIDDAGLLFWRVDGTLLPRGPEWLLEGVRDITALGGVLLRNLFVFAGATALVWMRYRREALILVGTVVSGWAVGGTIKLLVGRARPEIVPHLTDAGGASFPSGHSFNSALAYVALALAFAALSSRASIRHTLIGAAIVLSVLIALSRVWLGVHFPTDALAGWLGGMAWAFSAAALLQRPAAAAEELVAPAASG